MRRLLVLVSVFLLILFPLVAAGSQEQKSESVELTLWTPRVFDVGYMDPLMKLIEEYENLHPGVKISVEELNWDGISEKLETAMMTSSTPDIYIDGTARTAKLPTTNLVVDVSDIINDMDGWNESAISIGRVDNVNYLVPLTLMPPQVISINVSLAKKYGTYDLLPKDRITWDWNEFMAFLKASAIKSSAEGVFPIGLYAGSQSSDISYYSMLMSSGAFVLDDTHSKSTINTPRAVSAISNLKKMEQEGFVYPGFASMKDEEVDRLFYSGKIMIGISCGAMGYLPVFEEMKNQGLISEVPEIESYAWPTMEGSTTVIANWGANCIAIFKNENETTKINAAKDFLKFMLGDKNFSEQLWAASPSYGPTRMFGQKLNLSSEQLLREASAYTEFAKYSTSEFGILESFWGEIRQQFYPQLQSIMLGNKTSEKAIADFDSNVSRILANK